MWPLKVEINIYYFPSMLYLYINVIYQGYILVDYKIYLHEFISHHKTCIISF